MPRIDLLVPERGLRNIRRNRQWLALIVMLSDELGGAQETNEALAWKILKTIEETT